MTQHDSFTSSISLDFERIFVYNLDVNIYAQRVEPDYDIVETVLLSYNFDNVTFHALLSNDSSIIITDTLSVISCSIYNDTPLSYYNLTTYGHDLHLTIVNPNPSIIIRGTLNCTIEYTLDLMFRRPPKFMVSQYLGQQLVQPDIKFIAFMGVTLFALVLLIVSTRMMKY